jgi:hypothetical protein
MFYWILIRLTYLHLSYYLCMHTKDYIEHRYIFWHCFVHDFERYGYVWSGLLLRLFGIDIVGFFGNVTNPRAHPTLTLHWFPSHQISPKQKSENPHSVFAQ